MAIRILLIDPDIPFIVSIKQALENTGEFAVTVSAHGQAALDMLRRQTHDIAVIGFDVPDLDVPELIVMLRDIQTTLPIIAAPRTTEHQERVRMLDVQGAISKPFSARDLIPYVRSILARVRRQLEYEEDNTPLPDYTQRLEEPEQPEVPDLLEPHEEDDFGDVLDAVAQSPVDKKELSPDDQAFHDLVESLSGPDVIRPGRASLDELLTSLASDAPEGQYLNVIDNALDYVLDAIRRGAPLSPTVDVPNETTIGDAINDLFDPSFEGVLAALAGEAGADEPTYAQESSEEEWRTATESESTPHSGDEPPVTLEDSSSFPATAALTAITEDDNVTLNDLLNQIEDQLPNPPQLKPLPSWEQEEQQQSGQKMARLFDQAEAPFLADPAIGAEDTRPSQAILDEIARVPVQETDTTRAGLPPEPEITSSIEADLGEMYSPQPENTPLLSMADLMAMADLPPAVHDFVETPEIPPVDVPEISDQQEPEFVLQIPELGDNSLVSVPAEEAARLLGGEEEEPEPADESENDLMARIAVQLTQFSLESSAQTTILSRPGLLLAQAGSLSEEAVDRLFQVVDNAWHTSTGTSNALIRFITLPDLGEFLLYSTLVEEDFFLSMVFAADTPVHTIRRQAARLSQSLASVPEETAEADQPLPEESETDVTSPNRPTDLLPPEGLYGAVADHLADRKIDVEPVSGVVRPDSPYVAYTCLWLPTDPGLELTGDLADGLAQWLIEITSAQAWDLEALDVRPDYVQMTLHMPIKTLPDRAIQYLKDETMARCLEFFPAVVDGSMPLWADGYYVVTPPRDLSEREIARFITYQRQSQLG